MIKRQTMVDYKERFDWDINGIFDYETDDEDYISEYEDLSDLLNEQNKTIKELDKYCTACDDTLMTIQDLTYKLLTIVFENAESKADYCRLLNELDNKDLSFIHDCIMAINKCDLMKMEELKREYW